MQVRKYFLRKLYIYLRQIIGELQDRNLKENDDAFFLDSLKCKQSKLDDLRDL